MDDATEALQLLEDLARTAVRAPVSFQVAIVVGAFEPIVKSLVAGGLPREVIAAAMSRVASGAGLELPPRGVKNLG